MPTLCVWLTPDQAPFVERVASLGGFDVVGAGTPSKGAGGAVARALSTDVLDDVRSTLLEQTCDLVWLHAPGDFGITGQDLSLVDQARERGIRLVSTEPIPGTATEWTSLGWSQSRDPVHTVPLARTSKPVRRAMDAIEQFGHIRTLAIHAWCGPTEGTLGSQLYSAMDLARSLLGDAESIDATYVEPAHGRGLHALPGESLRDLRGDVSAHLRFPDGRCASIVASDQAGRFDLDVHAIGSSGRLEINTRGVDWIDGSGEVIEHASNEAIDGPAIMAEALASRLDSGIDAPVDQAGVLSLAQAALLSARTGQPESPATIRRMAGV